MTTQSQKHRAEYKEKGMVQINAWVPFEDKEKVMAFCRDLRKEKLSKNKENCLTKR